MDHLSTSVHWSASSCLSIYHVIFSESPIHVCITRKSIHLSVSNPPPHPVSGWPRLSSLQAYPSRRSKTLPSPWHNSSSLTLSYKSPYPPTQLSPAIPPHPLYRQYLPCSANSTSFSWITVFLMVASSSLGIICLPKLFRGVLLPSTYPVQSSLQPLFPLLTVHLLFLLLLPLLFLSLVLFNSPSACDTSFPLPPHHSISQPRPRRTCPPLRPLTSLS